MSTFHSSIQEVFVGTSERSTQLTFLRAEELDRVLETLGVRLAVEERTEPERLLT
jgi:hypothetical protein